MSSDAEIRRERAREVAREWLRKIETVFVLASESEEIAHKREESCGASLASVIETYAAERELQGRIEEAKEWDTTAQYHITNWVKLNWRNKRLAELERLRAEQELKS